MSNRIKKVGEAATNFEKFWKQIVTRLIKTYGKYIIQFFNWMISAIKTVLNWFYRLIKSLFTHLYEIMIAIFKYARLGFLVGFPVWCWLTIAEYFFHMNAYTMPLAFAIWGSLLVLTIAIIYDKFFLVEQVITSSNEKEQPIKEQPISVLGLAERYKNFPVTHNPSQVEALQKYMRNVIAARVKIINTNSKLGFWSSRRFDSLYLSQISKTARQLVDLVNHNTPPSLIDDYIEIMENCTDYKMLSKVLVDIQINFNNLETVITNQSEKEV